MAALHAQNLIGAQHLIVPICCDHPVGPSAPQREEQLETRLFDVKRNAARLTETRYLPDVHGNAEDSTLVRRTSLVTVAGVGFVRPPSVQSYGTVAVFKDLYGNLWDLVELATDTSTA